MNISAEIEVSKALSASDLLAPQFRGRPANVMLARAVGVALGLDPIIALTQLSVVDGRPVLPASVQAALVRRAGHRLRVTTNPKTVSATAVLIRADDPDYEHTVTWSRATAETAGLWGKGTAWKQYPLTMLANRATTELIRRAASDALLGTIYDPEELGGESEETHEPPPVDQAPADDADIIDVTDAEVLEDLS